MREIDCCERKRILIVGHIGRDYFLKTESETFSYYKLWAQKNRQDFYDVIRQNELVPYNGGTAGNVAKVIDKIGSLGVGIFTCCSDTEDYFDNSEDIFLHLFMTPTKEKIPLCLIMTDGNKQESVLIDDTLCAYNSIQEVNIGKNPFYEAIHITTTPPNFTLKLVKETRENDSEKIISFAPGQNLNLYYYKTLKEIFKYIDILFVNEKEMNILIDMSETYPDFNVFPNIIVNTRGEKEIVITTKNVYEKIFVKPVHVDNVIDTTGAGDAFSAGFLSRYLIGDTLDDCAKYGAIVASFVVEKLGCQTNIPSWSEIYDRFKEVYGEYIL